MNARAKMGVCKPTVRELTTVEMSTALTLWIKRAQELVFVEENYGLNKNLELPMICALRTFRHFLDEIGQLRVGGRIWHAPVDYATKHPILLPADQLVT